jgi:outer membrane protein
MTLGALRRFWVALVVVLGCAIAPTARAETSIAVIDTQRVIMQTEDGLRAQATLKKLFDSRQRELDRKQADLQKEREDIEKQRGVLSKKALQRRIDKWQQELVQLQSVFVEYNKELQKKQSELTEPIFRKAMSIITRMAQREGIDLVVDKQAVPYVRSDLDLTDRVIMLYNQGGAAGGEAGDAKPKEGAKQKGKAAGGSKPK